MYTEDSLRAIIDAVRGAGSQRKAAKELGVTRNYIDSRMKIAAERGMLGFNPVLPGYTAKSISSRAADGSFVKQVKEHGEIYEVPEGQVIKGESALIDADNRVMLKWVKTGEDKDGKSVLFESIKKSLQEASCYAVLPPEPDRTDADLLAFYPVADVHLGAFAWREETGNDYDLKIAERILKECMGELVSRSAPAETAIILDLGDFFHGDNSRNQTSKSGNPLDIDTRHPKVVEVGFMAVVWMIELALQKHKKVIYRKLPGNHDEETSPTFALGIWAYFRNNPRVEVDTSPKRTFVHHFGKVLLSATHGDMMKMADLAGYVAAYYPKEWGGSLYRHGWTGHIHNKQVITSPGMLCESLNSPAGRDAWHAAMGFTSPRNMISVTYHKERGERDRLTVPVV